MQVWNDAVVAVTLLLEPNNDRLVPADDDDKPPPTAAIDCERLTSGGENSTSGLRSLAVSFRSCRATEGERTLARSWQLEHSSVIDCDRLTSGENCASGLVSPAVDFRSRRTVYGERALIKS